MRPRCVFWLRVAALVSLLFAIGHTLGGRKAWSPAGGNVVLSAMGAYTFDVEGVSRTYLDFYRGFGFSLSVFMLLQAVILWQLAALATRNASDIRPSVAAFAAASFATTVIAWAFILPVPALFSGVLTVCLIAAAISARPVERGARAISRIRRGAASARASA